MTYDWIVVGGGIAGSALGYELAKVGFSVLLLEQDAPPKNATHYSYGGIAYWSANHDLTRPLCHESRSLYPTLGEELEQDIQFRELDLLLTIEPGRDVKQIAALYQGVLTEPTLISPAQACELEPLLNGQAIAAALHVKHGHVEPELTAKAYQTAMERLGGRVQIATVTGFVQQGSTVQGVHTSAATYHAANVIVSAGALSRALLKQAGVTVPVYFTHAEVVDVFPTDFRLRSLLMPAELKRFSMEATAGDVQNDALWDDPTQEITPAILDVGAIQFVDGRLRLGQMTRALTHPDAPIDAAQSEADLRAGAGRYLPMVGDLPGVWGHCCVAFSGDRLPLIGAVPQTEGLHVFSGFSNPFAILPPLARRYAQFLTGKPDPIVQQMSPKRFFQGA